MTPYDRAWDMGSFTEYMWSYDGICQVVRIPDAINSNKNLDLGFLKIKDKNDVSNPLNLLIKQNP